MLETPHITQSTAQQAAVIQLTIPRDQIRTMMGLCGRCMSRARSRIPIRPPGVLNSTSPCWLT